MMKKNNKAKRSTKKFLGFFSLRSTDRNQTGKCISTNNEHLTTSDNEGDGGGVEE